MSYVSRKNNLGYLENRNRKIEVLYPCSMMKLAIAKVVKSYIFSIFGVNKVDPLKSFLIFHLGSVFSSSFFPCCKLLTCHVV